MGYEKVYPLLQARFHQEIVSTPMERIAMDIMGPWPQTPRGKEYVLVVQDYFSKGVEAWTLKRHMATDVAKALVHDFFSRVGAPERIHSDQGAEYSSSYGTSKRLAPLPILHGVMGWSDVALGRSWA